MKSRKPIRQLGEIADSYASGQYDSSISYTPYIEFRPLVTVLDEMAASLQRYSEDLERLVEQRTTELQIAIEQLEREISERGRAEESLRELEERYRVIAGLVSDFAFSLRVEQGGSFVREWTTESYDRITGYAPEERDKLGGVLNAVHPDDRPNVQERLQVILSGQPITIKSRITTNSSSA